MPAREAPRLQTQTAERRTRRESPGGEGNERSDSKQTAKLCEPPTHNAQEDTDGNRKEQQAWPAPAKESWAECFET